MAVVDGVHDGDGGGGKNCSELENIHTYSMILHFETIAATLSNINASENRFHSHTHFYLYIYLYS